MLGTIHKEKRVKVKYVGFAASLVISAVALGQEWKFFSAARISSIVQWQGNNTVLVEVAPNIYCSVGPEEKANLALVMTLYSSGRRADIHCFPTPITMGGISAYPLHRIIAR